MAAKGVKKGLREVAARWFGLLGVIAATAAVVLVPISLDTEAVFSDPNVAYHVPELRTLLAASAVLLVAVAGTLAFNRGPLRVPMLFPALALLGVSALSTFLSERPFYSLYGDRSQGLLSVAAEVLIFYALARGLVSFSRVRLFLAALTTAAALVSVYAIAQNYGFDPVTGWANAPFQDFGRSFATTGNSLLLSAYLVLTMGAGTALWLASDSRLGRAVWLVTLAIIGAAWIYAESRGALLGAGIALPLVLLAVHRKMGSVRPFVVPIAVLVTAMVLAVAVSRATGFSTLSLRVCAVLLAYLALVAVFAWMLEHGRARLALVFVVVVLIGAGAAVLAAAASGNLSLGADRADAKPRANGDISSQTRLYIWRDTVPMILERPLLGHGTNNYRDPFRPHMGDDFKALNTDRNGQMTLVDRAHNHLLQIAATTGILGLAAYLWLLASFFLNAYRRGGWPLFALSGVVLAYSLQLLTSFTSVATDVVFWGLLGVSAALMNLRDREDDRPPEETGSPQAPAPKGRSELVAAAVVVGVLAAIAMPTFLEQRRVAAKQDRADLILQVRHVAKIYERTYSSFGAYPKAGVYDRKNPVVSIKGSPKFRPTSGTTITTETTPEGDLTVEGKSTILAGTSEYSYKGPR